MFDVEATSSKSHEPKVVLAFCATGKHRKSSEPRAKGTQHHPHPFESEGPTSLPVN